MGHHPYTRRRDECGFQTGQHAHISRASRRRSVGPARYCGMWRLMNAFRLCPHVCLGYPGTGLFFIMRAVAAFSYSRTKPPGPRATLETPSASACRSAARTRLSAIHRCLVCVIDISMSGKMPRLVFAEGTLFLCSTCRRILPIRELRPGAIVGPRIARHECSECAERYRVADDMIVDHVT